MKRHIKVSLQKPNGTLFYFLVFGCKLYALHFFSHGLTGKYVRPQTVLLQKYFLFNLVLMANFVIIIFLDCF